MPSQGAGALRRASARGLLVARRSRPSGRAAGRSRPVGTRTYALAAYGPSGAFAIMRLRLVVTRRATSRVARAPSRGTQEVF